jgi:hypothetical protein
MVIMKISLDSLPLFPAVSLHLEPGTYHSGETVVTMKESDYTPNGPVLRVSLVDENGTFVAKWTEYAVVEMDEGLLRKAGGEAGLELMRATGRCTTSLYLICGGMAGVLKVVSGKKFTKFLPNAKK